MRIALIGAGYWGVNLIRVFRQLGCLDLICDFSSERLAQLAIQYPDVRMEKSYQTVLDDRTIDAVVIATPAECHYRRHLRIWRQNKSEF
jgi:UDP-2-acetamido-3-amino-2,3-dideoxy-glucuronate N-acetyltransferase